MSIKEAKKLLKLWTPIVRVPAHKMDNAEKRQQVLRKYEPYAKKLNKLTGNYLFIQSDCNVEYDTINWPLKTYSQEVVLNW